MLGNRDLEFIKINRSDFQAFFHKFYSRFINGEGHGGWAGSVLVTTKPSGRHRALG